AFLDRLAPASAATAPGSAPTRRTGASHPVLPGHAPDAAPRPATQPTTAGGAAGSVPFAIPSGPSTVPIPAKRSAPRAGAAAKGTTAKAGTSKAATSKEIRSLADSVRLLPGVGEARVKQLAKLGISTIRDVIRHYPRSHN